MPWATKNLVQLITKDRLDEMKKLLQPFSPIILKHIIHQKYEHCSLLFIAILHQRVSIVNYLLSTCEADPNDVGLFNETSCPCLLMAAIQDNLEIVTCLLRNGADVNVTNVYARTALFIAVYNENKSMVRCLVENGADVNKADYKGTTCLMVALSNEIICRFLINNGADISRVNNDGRTALMLAVENQNLWGISLMLYFGADIHFKNDYGENATFIAAMSGRWDIVKGFAERGLVVDMMAAEVYEIKSCREVIRKDPTETISLWKKAVGLRKLPPYTPLFKIDSSYEPRQNLDWIRNCFDHITGSAILFMVSRLTLLNPHTLAVLRDAVCQIESPAIFVILYRNFLQSLRAADNRLFEKAFKHINLMSFRFLLEWSDSVNVLEIFKSFVLQIENLFERVHSSAGDSLPLVFQIKSYLKLFMDFLKLIIFNFPNNTADITEEIKTVVKADNLGSHNFSLLHLCVKNEYPISLTRVFLKYGADVMRVDESEKTAVHYMCESTSYRTKEAVNMFLQYGFQLEKFKNEICLPCTLRKGRMLRTPINYITLKCLAAEVVSKRLCYEDQLPVFFQNVIYSHT